MIKMSIKQDTELTSKRIGEERVVIVVIGRIQHTITRAGISADDCDYAMP